MLAYLILGLACFSSSFCLFRLSKKKQLEVEKNNNLYCSMFLKEARPYKYKAKR